MKRNVVVLGALYQRVFFIILLVFCSSSQAAEGITYQQEKFGPHVAHILTINPEYYDLKYVLGQEGSCGRESVREIAERYGAIAAINGGFFHMGGGKDGVCAGISKEQHIWNALPMKTRGAMGIGQKGRTLIFDRLGALGKISFMVPEGALQTLSFTALNKAPQGKEVAVFNRHYGRYTRTPRERYEVVIEDGQVARRQLGGNSSIPEKGWVPSFVADAKDIPTFHKGMPVQVEVEVMPQLGFTQKPDWETVEDVIGGAPILRHKGKAIDWTPEKFLESFIVQRHARTVMCVMPDKKWKWIVLDHTSGQGIRDMTYQKVYQLLRNQGKTPQQIQEMTVAEMTQAVQASEEEPIEGLTLAELAQYIQALGCEEALNLDGGSSSTLYYEGDILNIPYGDEPYKDKRLPWVGDALLVLPKK